MSFVLEFQESEVRDAVVDGDTVRIRFAAAAVVDAARERGWLPAVALTLAQATLAGDVAQAFGKIAEGQVRQDGRTLARLPLPAALAGPVELQLRLANGTRLTAHGHGLVLAAAGTARFTADLSC